MIPNHGQAKKLAGNKKKIQIFICFNNRITIVGGVVWN